MSQMVNQKVVRGRRFPPNRCFNTPVSRNCKSCGKVRFVFEAKYCHMCGGKY